MWQALKGLVLLALLAPPFPVLVLAEDEPFLEQPVLEELVPEIEAPPVLIENSQPVPEETPPSSEPGSEPSVSEALVPDAMEIAVEQASILFTGIGQVVGDTVSDHMQSGEWYLGQTDIFFTSPGFLRFVVVFPDTKDPDFIDCKDTVYGTNTLNLWFGKGTSLLEAMTSQFVPTHRAPREDGGCVYENREGIFVYPGPSYSFLLNNGYGPSAAFDYLGSSEPAPGLGIARISNSHVNGPQLIWKKESKTISSLKYLMSLGDEAPPVFGTPLDSEYVLSDPGVTLSELLTHEVLAQGTSEDADGFNYPLSYAGLNESPYFKKNGTIGYVRARLGYYHDSPNSRVYFAIEGRDCRTPEKMLFEWGIYSGGKGNFVNDVIIGPFSGSECLFEPADPEHVRETAVVLRTMFNHNRSDMSTAGKNNMLDVTLYSSEVFDPCAERICVSNVLFLPGIKGSRLYINEGTDERRLWEPNGDGDVPELFLNENGKSERDDVYVKPGGVVDDIAFNLMNIYDLFIEDMDALQEDGTINDWEAVPYDWRLSLPDIVSHGTERDGKIFYSEATSTPYIEQTLETLAHSSQTGKVTIVAHSNGGLVTKALINKLGETEASTLIDKIIFVGVPQSGAPQALGALLYGEREKLPTQSWLPSLILDQKTARAFAEDSPMGYHLLPSQAYFDAVREDFDHPVARFISGYPEETSTYNGVIGTFDELSRFLRAEDGGRTKPDASNLETANVLNSTLIEYSRETHAELDSWTPPEGVKLYQVAGWGQDTIAGVEFYEECGHSGCKEKYRPLFTEDGDGVVPVPSALLTKTSGNVKNYWIDLVKSGKDHGNILGFTPLLNFVNKVYLGENPLSDRVTETSPTSTGPKRLRFLLHSPLSLELQDSVGNKTNEENTGIENSSYGEFGEVKFISAPTDNKYTLLMKGYAPGTFSVDIQELSGSDVTSTATIADVPVSEQTVAFLKKEGALPFVLSVDLNGDSQIDLEIQSQEKKTVSYEASKANNNIDYPNLDTKRVRTINFFEVEKSSKQKFAEEVLGTSTLSTTVINSEEGSLPDEETNVTETKIIKRTWLEVLYNLIKQILDFVGKIL